MTTKRIQPGTVIPLIGVEFNERQRLVSILAEVSGGVAMLSEEVAKIPRRAWLVWPLPPVQGAFVTTRCPSAGYTWLPAADALEQLWYIIRNTLARDGREIMTCPLRLRCVINGAHTEVCVSLPMARSQWNMLSPDEQRTAAYEALFKECVYDWGVSCG